MSKFFQWLDQSSGQPEDSKENTVFGECQRIWDTAAVSEEIEIPDKRDQWRNLKLRLDEAPAPRTAWPWLKPKFQLGFAALSLLIAIVWLGQTALQSKSYTTARGEERRLRLPDLSIVELNADSRLTLHKDFNQSNRQVHLAGEAFFSVKKGEFPFLIETESATIRVVGTAFNVFARNALVEVGVREGTVEISSSVSGEARRIILSAGQFISLTPDHFPDTPQSMRVDSFPAWQKGQLYFDQAPLERVCSEIERRFDITINIADPALNSVEVTGLFTASDPASLLSSICVLIQRDYRYANEQYLIE